MFWFRRFLGQELKGEKTNLRPLKKEDLPAVFTWLEDSELLELGFGRVETNSTFQNLIQAYKKEIQSNISSFFAIENKDKNLIGFSSFTIFGSEKRARIGILIGSKQEWNKGYGRDAVKALLHYLFSTKKMNLVELDTGALNKRAQRCFQACGFKHTQKEWAEMTGQIWYEIKKEEFFSSLELV